MALPATEPFTGGLATLSDPPWQDTGFAGVARTVRKDGTGLGTTNFSIDCLETWDSDVFGNDQYSQFAAAFTGAGTAATYLYLIARVTTTATTYGNGTWYWFWSDGGSDTALLKATAGGGTTTTLATANSTTFTSGDVFKLICSGTTISVQKNGSQILTATDSALTSGVAGMGANGTIGTVLFDNWQGDNLAAAVAQTPYNPWMARAPMLAS